jgi:hypothetical protein
MSSPDSHRDTIEQIAESFLARYRRGERPSMSEYVQRHPDHAEPILELPDEVFAGPRDEVTAEGAERKQRICFYIDYSLSWLFSVPLSGLSAVKPAKAAQTPSIGCWAKSFK